MVMAVRLSTGARTGLASTAGVKELFDGGFIGIFTGGQPADADSAETGSLLVTISTTSGTGGISLGTAGTGVLPKAAPVWSGLVGTAGVAGWFRLYDSAHLTGTSGTAVRMDGNCGVSGSDMVLSNTSQTVGATLTIDQATFTEPAS
jgi:hypothetical protein